ncbi:MAG: ketoacyl-ACP synthase III [Candidatus Bipolaricaulota bacterium]|nr:ketoacyl-ACP synthase III [Candidatus Bipolaricaulota bacterium]
MGARIVGTGSCLPQRRVSNADLEGLVDTSDEWIVQRTGIRTRYLLSEGEVPSDLGVVACRRALEAAGRSPADVDLLLVATTFPDMTCPGTSPFVAQGLGMQGTPFFDLTAGCTGFVYGLAMAEAYIQARLGERVLVLGFETLSRVADWSDRRTCVLFGDGAGAVLLERGAEGEGILGVSLRGDPEKALLLHMPAGGTRCPASHDTVDRHEHFLRMEGSGVFRSAVPLMREAMDNALRAAHLTRENVDWIVPHQANVRIIDAFADRLALPRERVIINVDRVANTSAASIPIALDEAVRDGRILHNHVVVLTAFGAGVTYGAVVARM